MTRGTWKRRIALTAVATAAVTAMAVPAGAQAATATSTSAVTTTAATTAASEDVGYDTWQQDCQTVMNQALPYLKQRIAATKPGE
jgi:hypothetical protein